MQTVKNYSIDINSDFDAENLFRCGYEAYYIEFEIYQKNDSKYPHNVFGCVTISGERRHLRSNYKTKEEVILAAQEFYIEEITAFMPNIATKENIKPLHFNNGKVCFKITLSVKRHEDSDNYKIIGQLNEITNSEDDESSVILDLVDSMNLGYGATNTYNEIATAGEKILKLLVERNFLNIIDL